MLLKEDLLHFIWQRKFLFGKSLFTQNNQELEVIHPGYYNTEDGPDFKEAKVRIAGRTWVGSVEMHVKASDWVNHKHSGNQNYSNVILHVVYEDDSEVEDLQNRGIPTLEIKPWLPSGLLKKYDNLHQQKHGIPCAAIFPNDMPSVKLSAWKDRLAVERFEEKYLRIQRYFELTNKNFSHTFFVLLSRYFGSGQNRVAFEELALKVSPQRLFKIKDQNFGVEAVLFGLSGLLNQDTEDAYPRALQKEWNYQQQLINQESLMGFQWNFKGNRPSNFPTIRISQLAAILSSQVDFYSLALHAQLSEIRQFLADLEIAEYWKTHYNFAKKSTRKSSKSIGRAFQDKLIINVIIPFRFFYHKSKGNNDVAIESLQLLRELTAEKNNIIKQWLTLSVDVVSAYDSQAFLQLKTSYCDSKKCTSCAIGNHILMNHDR